MDTQNGLLNNDTLAAIRWLGMPEGTPFPLEECRVNEAGSRTGPETELAIPEDDPDGWRDAFWRWIEAECVLRPRCFGGIGCLHLHFCDWAIAHDAVPCTRRAFERLLADEGFLMADGMVSELILKEDWDACHQPGGEAMSTKAQTRKAK